MVTWDQPKFMTDSIISFSLISAWDHEANILKKCLIKRRRQLATYCARTSFSNFLGWAETQKVWDKTQYPVKHFVKNANQMHLKASDSWFINTQRIYPSHEIINLFRPETPYNTCQQQISCGECESSEFHLSWVFLSVAAYYFRQYLYDLKASRILNQWHLEAKKS